MRQQVAEFHSRYDGLSIDPDHIVVGPGSKILIFSLLACFSSADVLLVTPSWVSYEPQAEMAGHNVLRIETSRATNWRLTPEKLNKACASRKDKSKACLLILNYPGKSKIREA